MECPSDEVARLLPQTAFRTHSPTRQPKACSNILLTGSGSVADGQRPNSGSQLPINDANDGRLIPADGGAERRSGRYFHKVNSPSLQQRHDLVSAVGRGVACYDRENQRVSPCGFTYLLDSDHGPATAYAEPQQAEDPRGDLGVRRHEA